MLAYIVAKAFDAYDLVIQVPVGSVRSWILLD